MRKGTILLNEAGHVFVYAGKHTYLRTGSAGRWTAGDIGDYEIVYTPPIAVGDKVTEYESLPVGTVLKCDMDDLPLVKIDELTYLHYPVHYHARNLCEEREILWLPKDQ